ncbi:hypothetical protein PSN45_004116 [Yamadazyma tenuis]|uniref:Metallo-beta-lactamase domain-containing protein n=1 Tax=Candida tenuis (strain ATCC 10573 / BCRC 21748 / CBS 615 / JCM 9827 / NBRC 10315 / NRRL Y-1498 / VKM Y-70) TaxID=590646 RepID=G3B4F7_CANTC|nr:uncharacterized protein CANTEDRAFT_104888 [Yamadazyma tenuis ATCC 10573]EGV63814.1 hypothetical protein CANTEDRAFT_104888 [Yamadazyma tenuis ATCC 10573]WEJ96577.1 hypothetical protein PSN45_004116 [Yamadazyma tenuis]
MYPTPLKAVVRNLTENVVIASTPFTRAGIINFGARMSLFHYNGEVIVWSAIPYGDEVVRSLKLLTGREKDFNVTYLIIPDAEHTMAAKSFKEQYPNLKIIGMDAAANAVPVPIDYPITSKYANKLIDSGVLKEVGIQDESILSNFEFVYLPSHRNKELVLFDKNSKILFEADLLLCLGPKGTKLEQYSPELGFPDNFNPHGGTSFLAGFTHPDSGFFKGLVNRLVKSKDLEVRKGLQTIYNWDFTKMVPCHGNVINEGKPYFKKFFDFVN